MRWHDLRLGAPAVALAAGLALAMADAAAGEGTPITEEEVASWNIDIHTPSGRGLPEGQGTAVQGDEIFLAKCGHCHGETAEGGPFYGTMVGGVGSFVTEQRVLTPGSMYPYAPILFDYIRRTMPMDQPQTLTNDEVYALSAYLLHRNGLIGETDVVSAETLPGIEMPNRNGFILDDRPDTGAVRCFADCTPL
jgi:S-disulfanyl-L-cysteine oxidoreductase SoxD